MIASVGIAGAGLKHDFLSELRDAAEQFLERPRSQQSDLIKCVEGCNGGQLPGGGGWIRRQFYVSGPHVPGELAGDSESAAYQVLGFTHAAATDRCPTPNPLSQISRRVDAVHPSAIG